MLVYHTTHYYFYGSLHFYSKGCVPKKSCDAITLCGTTEQNVKCTYECCSEDLCNSSRKILGSKKANQSVSQSSGKRLCVRVW